MNLIKGKISKSIFRRSDYSASGLYAFYGVWGTFEELRL